MISKYDLCDDKMKKELGQYSLLSINHAAKELKVSHYLIRNLIDAGKLGVIIAGKREKVPLSEIERFIAENTVRKKRDRESSFIELSPSDILVEPQIKGDTMEGEKILEKLMKEVTDGDIN